MEGRPLVLGLLLYSEERTHLDSKGRKQLDGDDRMQRYSESRTGLECACGTQLEDQGRIQIEDSHSIQDESDMDDTLNASDALSDSLDELTVLLPDVLSSLQAEGQLATYMKFTNMLASKQFPLNNICYLLFLDLVEWFSCKNTSRMRYRPETIKFWQIGFRLFHGKFLRFMS